VLNATRGLEALLPNGLSHVPATRSPSSDLKQRLPVRRQAMSRHRLMVRLCGLETLNRAIAFLHSIHGEGS